MIKKIVIAAAVIIAIIAAVNIGLYINFKAKTDDYEAEAAALTDYSFITSTDYIMRCESEFTGLMNYEVRFNEWTVPSYDMTERESRIIFEVNPLFTDFSLEDWHWTTPIYYENFPQDILPHLNRNQVFIHPNQKADGGICGNKHLANCPAYVSFKEPMTYDEVVEYFGAQDKYRVKWCWVDTYNQLTDYSKTFTTGYIVPNYYGKGYSKGNINQAFGFMTYEGGYQGLGIDNALYIENPLDEFIRIMNTDYGTGFLADEIRNARNGITDGAVTAEDIKIIGVILEKEGHYDINGEDAQEIMGFDNVRFVSY